MTKSKVLALVYLDQFVYLGFFENEKKYIVSCTFRCSTASQPPPVPPRLHDLGEPHLPTLLDNYVCIINLLCNQIRRETLP